MSAEQARLANKTGISSVRRVIKNAISLLTSNVVHRATTFVLYALVARYLSAFEFGQLSLALTFFYMFQVLAIAGLETLITRSVAGDRTKTGEYIVNGSAIAAIFSLLSMIILLLLLWILNYSNGTTLVILLLSLGLLPYSLSSVCQAVFQAWEQMYYIVYASVPVNIAKIILAFLLLSKGYGLYHLIILLLASFIVTLVIHWWLLLRYISRPQFSIDLHLSLLITKSTSTFLGIDVIIAIMVSLNTILLSKLTSEAEVGFYSAASQLMVPLHILYQSIVTGVFPLMCKKFNLSIGDLKRITEHVTELLLFVAIPIVLGLFFFADAGLSFVYGTEFLPATQTMRILAWSLIPIAMAMALGQALFASRREKVTLRITLINVLVGLLSSVILIGQFGLIGAAIASVLTRIVDFVQHYVSVSWLLSGISLRRLAWRPILASLCMAVYLALMRNQSAFLVIITAGIVYTAILLILIIKSNGGYHRFKSQVMALYVGN